MDQQEEAQQQEQSPSWRDKPPSLKYSCGGGTSSIKRRIKRPLSKHSMVAKANMLKELLNRFKDRKTSADDDRSGCCEESIKDSFHFTRRTETKAQTLYKKTLQNAMLAMKERNENNISELVTIINSSKFSITPDSKLDFNIAHGISTMSCYDKIPREPKPEISHGSHNPLASGPGVPGQIDNFGHSFECIQHFVNNGTNYVDTCMRHCDHKQSLYGASALDEDSSQLPVIKSEDLIKISRNFREYCTNTINPQLNEKLEKFLVELSRLQRNMYNRDNVKGRFKRRYYAGFKEIKRRLELKKIKLVIIAPDIDITKNNGELDNLVHRFIDSCRRHEVPVIFGLSRRKLGYFMYTKGFVSCIGVANYEALEDILEDALNKILEAKNEFKVLKGEAEKMTDLKKICSDDLLVSERVKLLLKALALS